MMRHAMMQAAILIYFSITGVSAAHAETCPAPPRPFVPSNPADAQDYADLIRQDFETYLAEVQGYFRCLDAERARAFAEAQEVSQEYGRFIDTVGR